LQKQVSTEFTARDGRRFAFPVGIAFLVICGILVWREHLLAAQILGGIGGLLLVCGLLIPKWLGPVERAWMGFALLLSKFTTPIFMGVVYFVVITPVGLLRRTIGKNPMVHPDADNSYWVHKDPDGHSDMTRQF